MREGRPELDQATVARRLVGRRSGRRSDPRRGRVKASVNRRRWGRARAFRSQREPALRCRTRQASGRRHRWVSVAVWGRVLRRGYRRALRRGSVLGKVVRLGFPRLRARGLPLESGRARELRKALPRACRHLRARGLRHRAGLGQARALARAPGTGLARLGV